MTIYPCNLWIPLLILLPNLLFIPMRPRHAPPPVSPARALTVAEFVGRIGVIAVPLTAPAHVQEAAEIAALAFMLLCLAAYAALWGRFYREGREYRALYAPAWGVPVPMAVGPVLYFAASSALLHSAWMLAFSLVLGAGHIPAALAEYRRAR